MNTITVEAEALLLNGSNQIRRDDFNIKISGENVIIQSSSGSISWTLKYQSTEVDSEKYDSALDLFNAIRVLIKGGGDGSGVTVTWNEIEDKPLHEITTPIEDSEGQVPVYTQGGQLPVGIPEFPENAVPLLMLDVRLPQQPSLGTFILRSVDGVVSWVTE